MNDPLQALLDAGVLKTASFPANSRYNNVPIAQIDLPDGRTVAYLRRRFVPAPERHATLYEYAVVAHDRPDLIAARAFSDPELWWRLADANAVLDPADLAAEIGRQLRITLQADVPTAERDT